MDTTEDQVWLTSFDDVLAAFADPVRLRQASYDGAKGTIFENVLVVLDGEDHRRRRKLETPLFRRASLAEFERAAFQTIIAEEVDRAAAGRSADLVRIAARITSRAAAAFVGIDGTDSEHGLATFAGYLEALKQGAVIDWTTRPREEVLEETLLAAKRYREEFFAPSLARRRALAADGREVPSGDLLTLLLEADLFGDDEIYRESMHYLAASGGTSAMALVAAGDELLNWLGRAGAGVLRDKRSVHLAVFEALRLYPPTLWQRRHAVEDVELPSGRRLHAGQLVVLDIRAANRDRRVFGDDAEEFDPLREIPQHAARWGLAFGAGVHNCLGKHVAAGMPQATDAVFGLVPRSLEALLERGMRRVPDNPPALDEGTVRRVYLRYPVVFAGEGSRP